MSTHVPNDCMMAGFLCIHITVIRLTNNDALWLITCYAVVVIIRNDYWQWGPRRGLPNLRSLISLQAKFSILPKCLFMSLNRIHISKVLLEMSCGDTCQIWIWYSIANVCFCNAENVWKKQNWGNRLCNPYPWPLNVCLPLCSMKVM